MAVTPLEFLRGDWRVHRDVVDRRSGQTGVFTGTASFTAQPREPHEPGSPRDLHEPGSPHELHGPRSAREPLELCYAEDGELRFGEHRGPAYRRLRYRERADGRVAVHFEDGRDFYVLELSDRQQWDADHLCGPDLYTVSGLVTGPDAFTERWHAGGPAKDYDLITDYRRITADRPPSG
ncbi:DUF6314 family protein [Actinoplanes sp. N902-109]|uniref:DUF6314 family protein n=1 Tax=Actinoplanes sp. (strain N902-109) TaxID=649831 RepID=UPI0003A004DF|nr:DUF6314 family protein [Actinoplanes sp. N902-109]